jgi:hypothetical protein
MSPTLRQHRSPEAAHLLCVRGYEARIRDAVREDTGEEDWLNLRQVSDDELRAEARRRGFELHTPN